MLLTLHSILSDTTHHSTPNQGLAHLCPICDLELVIFPALGLSVCV
jgi:hypothetical protein